MDDNADPSHVEVSRDDSTKTQGDTPDAPGPDIVLVNPDDQDATAEESIRSTDSTLGLS